MQIRLLLAVLRSLFCSLGRGSLYWTVGPPQGGEGGRGRCREMCEGGGERYQPILTGYIHLLPHLARERTVGQIWSNLRERKLRAKSDPLGERELWANSDPLGEGENWGPTLIHLERERTGGQVWSTWRGRELWAKSDSPSEKDDCIPNIAGSLGSVIRLRFTWWRDVIMYRKNCHQRYCFPTLVHMARVRAVF